jgi:formate hydrogenlyase subunit 6/NADH:ubiquinone oxidoreductase subunit I
MVVRRASSSGYLLSLIGTVIHALAYGLRRNRCVALPPEYGGGGPLGAPRLTSDLEGTIRCVACSLCVAACPSHCIDLEAGWSEDGDSDRVPIRFELDLGRCVLCGHCVEACPHEAIEMGWGRALPVAHTAEQLLIDKAGLLSGQDS